MIRQFSSTMAGGAGSLLDRARAIGLWLYVFLGLASFARLLIQGVSSTPAPPPWHLLDLAYGWWIALSFVLLQVALGRRLLRSWQAKAFGPSGPTAWLISFTIGFWLSAIVLMAVAWAGLLNRYGLLLYMLAAAIVALRPSKSAWRHIGRSFLLPIDRWLVVALLLVGGVLATMLPFFIQSLLPNSDWDGASTHLPLADWFRDSGLSPIPSSHSNLIIPGTVHLVYALFQAIGAEQAIIPFNLLVSLLTCVAAASIASRFWGKTAGRWAFGVCLSINLLMEVGLDPRIDGFLAFFCTMAALGVMVIVLEGAKPGALVLAGIAFGNALGTKYTAIFPLLLWGVPVLWVLFRHHVAEGRKRWLAATVAVACLVAPSGYWYASNAVRFGDPVYPLLKGQSIPLKDGRSVRLADAVDALVVEARAEPEFYGRFEWTRISPRSHEIPRGLLDPISLFLHPDRHSRKPAHFLSPLLLLFFLLPFFRRERAAWLLLWMGVSVLLAIGVRTYLIRYGLVFYPVLAAGSGVVLASVGARWWRFVWTAALVAVLVGNVGAEWRKLPRQQPWLWLRGDHDRIGWLSQVGYNHTRAMPRFIRAFDELLERERLPREGKMLMVGEAKTHLLRFEAIPDISRTGHPWLARLVRNDGNLEAVHLEAWGEDIRFVLVNLGYFGWVKDHTTVDYEELAFSLHRLVQFADAHGRVRMNRFGMFLVQLDPPSQEPVP